MPPRVQSVHHVGLVLTGGTIGSRLTGDDGREVVLLADAASSGGDGLWREISRTYDVEFRVRRPVGLLSENLVPRDWLVMASAVRELVHEEGVEGVLLLHGTDTMGYTAAALSFLLADVEVPIVLTGSNLPPDEPTSDARKNIADAMVALRYLDRGVFVVFAGHPSEDGWVHLGTRVRKVRASGQAFQTINGPPVGRIASARLVPLVDFPGPAPLGSMVADVDPRVLAIRLYPGLDLRALLKVIGEGDIRGVVVELYASATGPAVNGPYSLPAFVVACVKRGVSVFTALGAAPEDDIRQYESGLATAAAGASFLHEMIPETAVVKLMWSLAQGPAEDVTATMLTPISGELTSR
jgi:L-asparaginase/Glu-tRNA(Gln) amidotransferase subunit D